MAENKNPSIPKNSLSQWAYNAIWLIVISAFALVLLITAAALVAYVFLPCFSECKVDQNSHAAAQIVLTVFTGAVGFLAGLFTPGPNRTLPDKNNEPNIKTNE